MQSYKLGTEQTERMLRYREDVHSVAVYQKYLTRLGELINFEPYHFAQTSDLLSFIISNTAKHEFSSIWKWTSCCNDVTNHVD